MAVGMVVVVEDDDEEAIEERGQQAALPLLRDRTLALALALAGEVKSRRSMVSVSVLVGGWRCECWVLCTVVRSVMIGYP